MRKMTLVLAAIAIAFACKKNETACGPVCCQPNHKCCGDHCCPPPFTCCGTGCCNPSQTCCTSVSSAGVVHSQCCKPNQHCDPAKGCV